MINLVLFIFFSIFPFILFLFLVFLFFILDLDKEYNVMSHVMVTSYKGMTEVWHMSQL